MARDEGGTGGGGGTVTSIQFNGSTVSTPNPVVGVGTVTLVNDQLAPGNSYYYGTDAAGVKGFYLLSSSAAAITSTNPHTPITAGVLDFIDAYQRTHLQIRTLKAAGTLTEGYYMVTDPISGATACARIILRAEFGNTMTTDAVGLFYNADYQIVGDYSGVPLQSGIGTNFGVWSAAYITVAGDMVSSPLNFKWYTNISGSNGIIDPSLDAVNWIITNAGVWDVGGTYFTNQVVIYNGQHWVNLTGVNGGAPDVTPADWLLLPRTAAGTGYLLVWDRIIYDFDNDLITARYDVFGNEYVDSSWQQFQWGNANVNGVIVKGASTVRCQNNKGTITACEFSNGVDITIELNALVSWGANQISNYNTTVVADPTLSFSNRCLNGAESNFDFSLSASGIFAAGVITLPASLHWIGKFVFTDAAGGLISNIVNGPTQFPFRFTCANAISNTISPIAIAGAVAGDIVSDGGNVILTGRTNGSDFYELIASGNVYMKNNVTALL